MELFKHKTTTSDAVVEQRSGGKVGKILILISLAVVILITAAGLFLVKNNQLFSVFPVNKKQTLLASIYNSREVYDELFSKLQTYPGSVDAKAGIVSHHFLAKEMIASFYNKISSHKVLTIFLVSPDHYNNYFDSQTIAYTSYSDWATPFGELPADKKAVDQLTKSGLVKAQDSVAGLEHGIYVEIPFIKNFFPNAKIVPIILKSGGGPTLLGFESLGKTLEEISNGKSIMLVSSDFSHNATVKQAKVNDKKSINVLNNLNSENLGQITNDCRQCLAMLDGYLGKNQYNFYLFGNKDSFDVSGQDENSVTSYVFGYYAKKDYAQIMFAGDLMFDRGIRYYADKNGGNNFIFDKILPQLSENDLTVVNLEGPVTSNKSISSGTVPGSTNNYFFTFDPSVAKTLFENNIRLVDLGNNHILNFGYAGLSGTKKYLDKENVSYFGAPAGLKSIIENVAGFKIGFVSYDQFNNNAPYEVVAEIKKIKSQTDFVFVFCHWGIEYQSTESDYQKKTAHQFVDAGADLVIGSHPHVIQPSEEYNGKRIYYSLGNFIFDQYFDENVRNGMGVVVKIDKKTKQLQFGEKKFYLENNGQTTIK